MECLDANSVQDLMGGALDDTARSAAAGHLDGCDDCRSLVSALAREAVQDTLRDTQKGLAATVDSSASIELAATMAPSEHTTVGDRPPVIRAGVTGRTLGRYRVLERLGAGAMGVVFRAEDPELGRKVALKLLHQPNAALTDRLVREARSMAQVNHPNVVAVYDVGVADGSTYIAMELVKGETLRGWQATPRTLAEITEAYLAAGRGLAAAHAAGIVHRDFKPDNCLVGDDGRVRVTDFGLASARASSGVPPTGPSLGDLNLTSEGSVMGTPAYMAPEQFLGGNVDPRTDQFNFCVALYEALYGQRPFIGKSFRELGDNVCEGHVRPAPASSNISGALRAIVLRGLSAKPGDRFPTMDHLLVELGRDRAKPWRRTAIAAAALAAVLGLGLVADWAVRDRVAGQIHEAFAATGVQATRATQLLLAKFDQTSKQVYNLAVMRIVTGHRDQADFGLGEASADADDLRSIHGQLVATDWQSLRDTDTRHQTTLVIADYKGRMLYTTADPEHPIDDSLVTQLPWIRRAIDTQKTTSVVLLPTNDERLLATGLLGRAPQSAGLSFFFTRTLLLGSGHATESSGQLMQVLDADKLLQDISLDPKTKLSLISPDGALVGELPRELATSAPAGDDISEIVRRDFDGASYEVQSVPLKLEHDKNHDARAEPDETIGHVVMARRIDGVLSLFPSARLVFALTMLGALLLACGTAVRARQITGAHA